MQIRVSFQVGKYSTISPSGVGKKPGTISPMPFSIQIPRKAKTQATFNKRIFLARGGTIKIKAATTSAAMADHIHGTRAT